MFHYKNNITIIVDPGYGVNESEEQEGEEGNSEWLTRFSSMGGGLGFAISSLRKINGKPAIMKY